MKKVIANFKMNSSIQETKKYLIDFLARVDFSKADITLCLPFTSLSTGEYFLKDTPIDLGAQNLSDEEDGKCTGEVSGKMLVGAGVKTVIVGHFERRLKFKENNKLINKKIKIALKNRMNVVLCVGETLAEKNTLKTVETLKTQISECLKGLYENELKDVIIAYDPIWAISSASLTAKTATVKEIEYAAKAIRKALSEDFSSKAANETAVIYGGSVTNKNIESIVKAHGIDGVLVGGACLDPASFANMINSL